MNTERKFLKVSVNVTPGFREYVLKICDEFKMRESDFLRRAISYTSSAVYNYQGIILNNDKLTCRLHAQINELTMFQVGTLTTRFDVGMSAAIRYSMECYIRNVIWLADFYDHTLPYSAESYLNKGWEVTV